MREATCTECGQRIEVSSKFGPLPLRCTQCKADHEQRLQQVRSTRRAARRTGERQRVVACKGCTVELEWSGKGRPPDRCENCRTERNREMNRRRSIAWIQANPERVRELQRQGYQRNAESIRARKLDQHYLRKYGLTKADRERLLTEQDGRCKICGQEPDPKHRGSRLHVDHCHTTGAVRALLCGNCNTAIGLFKENPEILRAAIAYLAECKTGPPA